MTNSVPYGSRLHDAEMDRSKKTTYAAAVDVESQPPSDPELHLEVKLLGDEDPLNWPSPARWAYTIIVVVMAGIVGLSSSIQTPDIAAIAEELQISRLMSTLGATTYLIGFGFGSCFFAPISELTDRNPVYYVIFLAFCGSTAGCALSHDITTFQVCRFLAGFFGSPSVSNSGGSITDLWPPSHRSVPFALFTAASFCGPVMAPIVGGFLTQYTSWRWNFWVVVIMAGVNYLVMLCVPETYAPRLLEKKILALQDGTRSIPNGTLGSRFTQSLLRPWIMLFTEPILFALSLYMAFIYGVLFLDFTAYPVVFQKSRNWSVGISGLSFLGLGAGMALATMLSPLVGRIHARYVAKLGPVPEARLPHLVFLAWLLPLGLFWFGWTALPPTPWIVPILAGVPFGVGLVMLFLGINSYPTDCYDKFSASALAANSMLRSLFGAGFAIFATDMYETLGAPWATSLLGFIALAMGLFPLLFYLYGPRLRAASKFYLKATQA